ncbi:hypothetical protein PSPO01_11748 [Paraphaeosphaeria sporulosa]
MRCFRNGNKKAKAGVDANSVQELVHGIFEKIHAKAYEQRSIVYWTSCPRFFEVADKLNELSTPVNDQIDFAIRRYDAGLSYPKVVHVNLEGLGNIYHRKCLLDDGYDDIPKKGEGLRMAPQREEAPSDQSSPTYNSGICSVTQPVDSSEPLDTVNCDVAKGIASGQIATGPGDDPRYDGDVTRNSDGSVSITNYTLRFMKMSIRRPERTGTLHKPSVMPFGGIKVVQNSVLE